ncbi:hypothetical protein HY798_00420 [Candidatus Falkowbacteria bacterium]|nr:hypothetical protein [Candidatus Falkowbacteria bacterium]
MEKLKLFFRQIIVFFKASLKKPLAANQEVAARALDFVVFGAIFLIFALCPLFFTGLAAQGISFDKMALFYLLTLIGMAAWLARAVLTGELKIKRTPLDWPIIFLLSAFILSTVLSVNQRDSFLGSYGNSPKGLIAVIIFALFYYLLVNNINKERVKALFWAMVGSSALIIIYSLLQLLGVFILPFEFARAVNFNPLESLTALTIFLTGILPLLVVGVWQTASIIFRVSLGVIIFCSLIILTLLNGFTFWPALILGMAVVLMFLLAKIVKISGKSLLIPVAVFLLLAALLVAGNFNLIKLNAPAEVNLSRGISWEIAKNSLRADPLLGSGPATFSYDFSKFKDASFNASPLWNVRFENAMGVMFELLSTVGALGALAVTAVALIILSLCFSSLIKYKETEEPAVILSVFAGLISVSVLALLFSFNNSLILFNVLLFSFAAAAVLAAREKELKTFIFSFRVSPKPALVLAGIFLGIGAGIVILFILGFKIYLADIYFARSLKAENVNQKIVMLNKAVSLAPYQDAYYANLANQYVVLVNQEAVQGKDQVKLLNYLNAAVVAGKKAIEISPNKANNIETLALIYENASLYSKGALELAENLYNQIMELDPQSPTPYLRLALINMARANAETDEKEKANYINEAIKKYNEALAKKSDLAAVYYGKAVAYEKLNDLNKAIAHLEKANLIDGSNVDYRFELGRLYFNRGVAQAGLAQKTPGDITKGSSNGGGLSVEEEKAGEAAAISRNNDINAAEQIFLDILSVAPNHANARYSLALLYQRTGESEKAKGMVKSLLDILQDEKTKEAVKKQFPGLY